MKFRFKRVNTTWSSQTDQPPIYPSPLFSSQPQPSAPSTTNTSQRPLSTLKPPLLKSEQKKILKIQIWLRSKSTFYSGIEMVIISFSLKMASHPEKCLQKPTKTQNANLSFPSTVYTGFRDIGFSVPFSIASLLIPVFFSYPTSLAYSYVPDPLLRIHLPVIQKAK